MITRHNYEELFLLYVDNELSPAERQSVEIFVKENPDLKEEMEALQQCTLISDNEASFGNLEPLLKEEDRDRFIFFPFRFSAATRIAAAAILLLLTGLGVSIAIKKNTTLPYAGIANPGVGIKNDHAPVTSAIPKTLYPKTTDRQEIVVGTNKPVRSGKHGNDHSLVRDPGYVNNYPVVNNAPAPDDPAPEPALTGTRRPVQQELALIDPVNTRLPERIFVEERNTGRSASFVTQTVQHDPAISSGDDFSEPAPAEKSKLRGIFRKVSRVFEKTTNRDEDDGHAILVGNLQIALK